MIIYEYKGGGYDGCWWEWNFFALHFNGAEDAEFHNILSTGYKGLKSYEEFQEKVQSEAWVMSSKLSMYNLDIEDQHFEFVDGMNASNAMRIARYLRDHSLPNLKGHCQECGEKFPVLEMDPTNYSGDGWGITYSAHDLVCETCMLKERSNEEGW